VANRRLSAALTINPRTQPLLDGTVSVEGVDLIATGLFPSVLFWRQLKFEEFDVSEMSISSLTIATSHGPTPWVAIPVFTTRVFFHTDMIVRADAGIDVPADLRGRRVGVPEYQQTRAVWVRGALQHEFGVSAHDIAWFMERTPERSHGGSTGFEAPAGIDLTYVPPDKDLGGMLLAGELDAAVHHFSDPTLVDRGLTDVRGRTEIRPLFPDRTAEARRYFAATGIYPINHCVVARRSLLEREPDLATRLFDGFVRAKAVADGRRADLVTPYAESGVVSNTAHAALQTDLLAYGVAKPRAILETLMDYLVEQGLTSRRVALDEIFAPATLGL
jgi:4,5-dihydroxyphthalate decarboxylase